MGHLPVPVIAVIEMYGPGFDVPSKGWIVSCQKDLDDIIASSGKFTEIVNVLGGIDPTLTLQNEGLCLASYCVRIARQIIKPLVLYQYDITRALGDQSESSRYFVRCRYHELLGDVLTYFSSVIAHMIHGDTQLQSKQKVDISVSIESIRRRVNALIAHPFTNAVIEHASQLGIPFYVLHDDVGNLPLIQLGMGASSRITISTAIDADSLIGSSIVRNKFHTQPILAKLGFPVPRLISLPSKSSRQSFVAALHAIGFPCVVKPSDAELGFGVTVGIVDLEKFLVAIELAQKYTHTQILIEQYVPGDYYRLVVLCGQLVRVCRLQPPVLIGDGLRSIQQILEEEEASEDESNAIIYAARKPLLSEDVLATLSKQNLSPHDVPEAGTRVSLRHNLVDRSDWSFKDFLGLVDRSLYDLAASIASSLGLSNAGIDLLSTEITRPVYCGGLAIIEVNAIQRLHPSMAKTFIGRLGLTSPTVLFPINVLVLSGSLCYSVHALAKLLDLDEYQGSKVAVPRSSLARFDSEFLRKATVARGLIVYSHPREVLLNRTVKSVLFLIDIQDLLYSGLPAPAVDSVRICGVLPAELREAWFGLLARVMPSLGEGAFCDNFLLSDELM